MHKLVSVNLRKWHIVLVKCSYEQSCQYQDVFRLYAEQHRARQQTGHPLCREMPLMSSQVWLSSQDVCCMFTHISCGVAEITCSLLWLLTLN